MDFQGPETADLANVHSLNRAWLDELRRQGMTIPAAMPGTFDVVQKLAALSIARAGLLSGCPFLIFALPEASDSRWTRLFGDDEQADLFDGLPQPPESVARLATATLGFLWELARRNPYAARLVSGASLDWCERLADSSPVRVFRFAAGEPGLLSPRLATHRAFWTKLLGAGTSDKQEIRGSAQLCALQTVLTRQSSDRYRRLPAAACLLPSPAMRVADRGKEPSGN
jgi:hypothetical protein